MLHAWPRGLRHGAVARPPSLAMHHPHPCRPPVARSRQPGRWHQVAVAAAGASSAAATSSSSSAEAAAAAGAGAASWPLLYRASRVACLSGLCYIDTSTGPEGVAELERRAAALGLALIAHGRCKAAGGTSWVVGDATIDYRAFAKRAGLSLPGGVGALPLAPPARRERFVLLRGVQWGAADSDVLGLSAALAQVWPTPFPREGSELVAHAGVARLAAALRNEVRGAVMAPPAAGGGEEVGGDDNGSSSGATPPDRQLPIVWAGHSLGGSIAKLLWVAEIAEGGGEGRRQQQQQNAVGRRRRRGAPGTGSDDDSDGGGDNNSKNTSAAASLPLPEVLTFGSPPVLAHARGGGSPAMMRALTALSEPAVTSPSSSSSSSAPPPLLDASRVAQYVLEGDPVPRALLSADPTFASLSQGNGLFSAALQLNRRIFGEGAALTPSRFLFEPLGVVKLVRWSPSGGSEVVPLVGSAEEVSRALMAGNGTAAARPEAAAAAAEVEASAAEAAAVAAAQQKQQEEGGTPPAAGGFSLFGSLRAWLDHHHGSYTQELEAAAISALRAEQRAAALERQGRGASSAAARQQAR